MFTPRCSVHTKFMLGSAQALAVFSLLSRMVVTHIMRGLHASANITSRQQFLSPIRIQYHTCTAPDESQLTDRLNIDTTILCPALSLLHAVIHLRPHISIAKKRFAFHLRFCWWCCNLVRASWVTNEHDTSMTAANTPFPPLRRVASPSCHPSQLSSFLPVRITAALPACGMRPQSLHHARCSHMSSR